jgi:hypothetical protein
LRGKSFVLSAAAGLAMLTAAHAAPGAALAVINVDHTADGLRIVGQALGLADATVSGEMTISRKGKAGSVTTKQGGQVEVAKGRKADIAHVDVSFKLGDVLDVRLVLKQDGAVISETTLKTSGG